MKTYKLLILSILLIIFHTNTYAQTSEAEVINTIKKTKCLSLMTNCDARQDYFQGASLYWQSYLENNFDKNSVSSNHPVGKLPDCPEDDINFPTEASTKYFIDKCMARFEIVVIKKKPANTPQYTTPDPVPVEDEVVAASLTANNSKKKGNKKEIEAPKEEPIEENKGMTGFYVLSSTSPVSGNVRGQIQINEKVTDSKGGRRFAIISEGKEVLIARRKEGEKSFSGAWNYTEISQGHDQELLRIARSCKIKLSEDETSITIAMQNVKAKPVGGGFASSFTKGLSLATSLASAYVAEESLSGMKLSDESRSSITSLGSMATEEFKKPTKWKIVTASKETIYTFEKSN
jgi:hypothetical protein